LSRIEEALKRLQSRGQPALAPSSVSPRSQAVASPLPANRKKVVIEGERHHVSTDELVRGGLLASAEHSAWVTDEFRRIKRPLIANTLRTGSEAAAHQNVIMITSGLPGAGKTFCSVNLAVSISLERELNVLLVDADVAKPHISRAFGLEGAPGLIDLLSNERTDVAEMLVRTDLNDILVLPAGKHHAHATELLASERMSSVVAELSTRYADRIVIVDSPPLLLTSEAQALAGQVGQIVVVVEAGVTSRKSLEQTLAPLDRNKAVNVVLNKVRSSGGSGQVYGAYGYGYHGNEGR
jgi:exopolysaccharide/PEP-CTERM locus tyrosine autokinase